MRPKTGFGINGENDLDTVAELASMGERLGYDNLWFPDERLLRNVYACLTVCAANTERMHCGTCVTNPYTRNPCITAAGIATVDEISKGRAILGVSAGGALESLGIERTSPAVAIREMVDVCRGLWSSQPFTYSGRMFKTERAAISFKPFRARIPVYIAARGPRVLELAGEIGDGAIIGGFASSDGLKYALNMVRHGLEKAGRDRREIETVAWLYTSISDDGDSARNAVRSVVMKSVVSSRQILDQIGVEMPSELRSVLESYNWNVSQDVLEKTSRMLPGDLVAQFSLAGTVEECSKKLVEIVETGIDQVAILPFATPYDDKRQIIARFQNDVMPRAFGDAAAPIRPPAR